MEFSGDRLFSRDFDRGWIVDCMDGDDCHFVTFVQPVFLSSVQSVQVLDQLLQTSTLSLKLGT